MVKEWNNVESTLVFSLFGYLSRLLTVYLFQSQNPFEKEFAIISIDMFASCILGIIDSITFKESMSWLQKGISSGFCGCASTFGSLIALSSYSFLYGIHDHSIFKCFISLSFMYIGTEASRSAYETGRSLYELIHQVSKKKKHVSKELEITNPTSSTSLSTYFYWIHGLFLIEIICIIIFIPFSQSTASFLFGFLFSYIGALARYFLSLWYNSVFPHFYLGTFICNVVGSLIASIIMMLLKKYSFSLVGTAFLSSLSDGFASALTTMSTFAKESNNLKKSKPGWYFAYSLCSVCCSFILGCLVFAFSPSIY